ncbi:MAG TPA: N-acetylmuramoyl-L-alanine amidase [Blastocatellia bacterium]|nr:N-acetylmuramoyl-L-alanine amidase [Blastocatellia bacterium]
MRITRHRIPAVLLTLVVGLWASVGTSLHAARVEEHDRTLPERIYASAASEEAALKQRAFEDRSPDDYPRVIDLYRQVTQASTVAELRDRAEMRMADLTREMALRTGDAAQFVESIDLYRRLVINSPDSPYLGEALTAIADIYERQIQDVDGAMAAYREIARRFPHSVSGREADANLARLDPSMSGGDTGTDIIGTVTTPGAEIAVVTSADTPVAGRVVNIRSFAGPDYARIVVDLNRGIQYNEKRDGTRVSYHLPGVELSQTLVGRRLSTPRGSILRGMQVQQMGDGVDISLDLAKLDSASAFMMDDPSRLIIDLRGGGARLPGDLAPRSASPGGPVSLDAAGLDVAGLAPSRGAQPDIPAPPAPLAPGLSPGPSGAPREARGPVRCIVLDPGHGGQDTGTIGPGGLAEKDVCLDIARRLRASLRAELPGVEIIMTRDSDRFVSLEERTAIANARNADLFISVHANASQQSSASGVETFVLDPSAAPQAAQPAKEKDPSQAYARVTFASQFAESRALAGYVQGSLVRGISAKSPSSAKDRGIKHASFAVLRGARMPSILAEVSFVSNPDDENRLRTPAFRQKIAASLTAGIRGYVRAVGSS